MEGHQGFLPHQDPIWWGTEREGSQKKQLQERKARAVQSTGLQTGYSTKVRVRQAAQSFYFFDVSQFSGPLMLSA